jgi:thioredoxin 1
MRGRLGTSQGMQLVDIAALDRTVAAAPGGSVTVLDFTAAWCAPCRQLTPMLEALVAEPAYAPRVRAVAIDVDAEQLLAQRYGVRSMPTLVFVRDGREVGRIVGSRPRAFVAGVLDRALAGDVAIASP